MDPTRRDRSGDAPEGGESAAARRALDLLAPAPRERFLDAAAPGDERVADPTALRFADAEFDAILFAGAIQDLDPDRAPAALVELRRVLRPGGRLVVQTPNRIGAGGRRAVNAQSWLSLHRGLRRAGFREVTVRGEPGPLGFVLGEELYAAAVR